MKLPAITPGPWAVGEDDHNGQAIVRSPHIEIATCWHHCVGSIETEMRSNAKAIAAVPVMLEALGELREYFDQRADAECDASGPGYTGNEEMRHLVLIDAALRLAGASE